MFMNTRDLYKWLDEHMKGDYSIMKHYVKQKDYTACTPLKYRGIWEHIGYVTIWNDFGGIDYEFQMYRPVGNGTVVYDVD